MENAVARTLPAPTNCPTPVLFSRIIPWNGSLTMVLSKLSFAFSKSANAAFSAASASLSWGILRVSGLASPSPNSSQSFLASSLSAISLSKSLLAWATLDSAEITASL